MPTATFRVLEGGEAGLASGDVPLPATIGRQEGNSLQLKDDTVSRFHAKVEFEDPHTVLTDLGSRLGTYVNGVRIQTHRLRIGDRVKIGRSTFLFSSGEGTPSGRPTAQDLGNVRVFPHSGGRASSRIEECRRLRELLVTSSVFCEDADARGLAGSVLQDGSPERGVLSEGFHRIIVIDALRGRPSGGGHFQPLLFLTEVCKALGAAFGSALDPNRFHAADVFQVLKDEPPSLFCFVHFDCVSAECLPLARAFTQGTHRVLFLNDQVRDLVREDEENNDDSVLAESVVRAGQELLESRSAYDYRELVETGIHLLQMVDLDALLAAIGDAGLKLFRQADRCFIIFAQDGRLIPKEIKTRRLGDNARFSRSIVRKCLDSRAAYVTEDAANDSAIGAAQSIAEFRIRSLMCVPLIGSDGIAFGVILLDTQDRNKKFGGDDLGYFTAYTKIAAPAIDNILLTEYKVAQERIRRELELAGKLQLAFLPQAMPEVPGYSFFAACEACRHVGGDFYDVFIRPDGCIVALLGDVAGKGVPAALIMSRLLGEARHCLRTETSLVSGIRLLNDSLILGGIGDRFVTMVAILLNPSTHSVVIVNAGHIEPLWYRASERKISPVSPSDLTGLPLGILGAYQYESREIHLEPGDKLCAVTDGVTEAKSPSGADFGEDGVTGSFVEESSVIDGADVIGARMLQALRTHTGLRPPFDDLAILAFGRR